MRCKHSPQKGIYATKKIAWIMALNKYQKWFALNSPYKCPHCPYYHLTTRQMGVIPADILPAFEEVGKKWDRYIASQKKVRKPVVRPSKFTFWWLKVRNRLHI